MRAFDASSFIHAWDHYPLGQFPPLWDWMAEQVDTEAFIVCDVADGEIKRRAPDCHAWLHQAGLKSCSLGPGGLSRATAIEKELGVEDGVFHPQGVGANDVLIIASALDEGLPLVSNENVQPNLPQNRRKYKIPAVCELESVSLPCMDFLGVLKVSGEVFDGSKRA